MQWVGIKIVRSGSRAAELRTSVIKRGRGHWVSANGGASTADRQRKTTSRAEALHSLRPIGLQLADRQKRNVALMHMGEEK